MTSKVTLIFNLMELDIQPHFILVVTKPSSKCVKSADYFSNIGKGLASDFAVACHKYPLC